MDATIEPGRFGVVACPARSTSPSSAASAAVDGDVSLAGQATTLNRTGLIVATTNVRHLSRFVPAALWSEIE